MQQQMATWPVLTEHDVRMFLQAAPERRLPWRGLAASTLGILGGAVAIFVLLNLPAYLQLNEPPATLQAIAAASSSQPSAAPAAVAAPAAAAAPTPSGPQIPNNTISVPGLGISAPVTWNVPLTDQDTHNALEIGTAHIQGTALPGQNGMAVISGHSSNYIWDKGQYNTIFAPLHKTNVGDEIDANYNGTTYVYKVTKIYEVKPTQLEVLEGAGTPGIRLVTCTPIGTALRRLVVEAVQVSPDPSTATPFTAAQFTADLPNAK